jgi:ABC-type sugar transport system permease subunit
MTVQPGRPPRRPARTLGGEPVPKLYPSLYAGRKRSAENMSGFLFILPAFIIIGTFFLVPAFRLFHLSFTDYSLLSGKWDWVGLRNFRLAFSDKDFLNSLWVTAKMAFFIVPVQGFIALAMAVLVNQKMRGVNLYRTVYFIPAIISFVAVAVIWKQMYSPTFGLISSIFEWAGLPPMKFLASETQALGSMIVACIWKSWGYYMVIFLSGLQEIPGDIREAARIDGVNPAQEFLYVTLPLIRKVTLFVVVITTMDALKLFIPAFVMTSGGPRGSTNTVVHFIWRNAFRLESVGYAAAMSTILFVAIVLITVIQFKAAGKDGA